MFEILTELLGYARKLLPLMELYMARRSSHPARNSGNDELQRQIVEALRANRESLMDLRSAVATVNQRLKVVDDLATAHERELSRIADQQRTMMIAIIVSAAGSIGALVVAILLLLHR